MLRIAICDDEQTAVSIEQKIVSEDLSRRGIQAKLRAYLGSEALWKDLQRGEHFDLLLLDIDMPGKDGIFLGMQLADYLSDTLLIYISNREDRVYDSFRASPFRFVRKSTLRAEWPQVMREALEELKRRACQVVSFENGNETVCVRPNDVSYIESLKKKQILHTGAGSMELSSSFYKILEQLSGLGFIQIHKSYAVNFRFIRNIKRNSVILDDQTQLPIGRAYLPAVRQEFHRLVMDAQSREYF